MFPETSIIFFGLILNGIALLCFKMYFIMLALFADDSKILHLISSITTQPAELEFRGWAKNTP